MSRDPGTRNRRRRAAVVLAALGLGALVVVWGALRYDAIRPAPRETVVIEQGKLRLHGDLYDRGDPGRAEAAILLLHSSNPLARRMPFNRVLAELLSERVPVLSADLRGYGDSHFPGDVTSAEDLDFAADIQRWVGLLAERYRLPERRVLLAGRGTGAAAVLQYMHRYPDAPQSFVLIVPPRAERIGDELWSDDDPPLVRRWERDMVGPGRVSVEAVRELSGELRLEGLPAAQRGRAVTLVDTPATMETALLRQVFVTLTEPKTLYAVGDGVNHYFGTRVPLRANELATRFAGPRSWQLYHPPALETLRAAMLSAAGVEPGEARACGPDRLRTRVAARAPVAQVDRAAAF